MSIASKRVGVVDFTLQLRKLTLYYCKTGGSSDGMRSFINNSIIPLCNENPSVFFEVKTRPGRHPYLKADYLNGYSKTVGVKNLHENKIQEHFRLLQGSLGTRKPKLHSRQVTANPSIQGTWQPFLNQHFFPPLEAVGRREVMKVQARVPHSIDPPPDLSTVAAMLGVQKDYDEALTQSVQETVKEATEVVSEKDALYEEIRKKGKNRKLYKIGSRENMGDE